MKRVGVGRESERGKRERERVREREREKEKLRQRYLQRELDREGGKIFQEYTTRGERDVQRLPRHPATAAGWLRLNELANEQDHKQRACRQTGSRSVITTEQNRVEWT